MMRERKRKQGEMENESKAHRKEMTFLRRNLVTRKEKGWNLPTPSVAFCLFVIIVFFFFFFFFFIIYLIVIFIIVLKNKHKHFKICVIHFLFLCFFNLKCY